MSSITQQLIHRGVLSGIPSWLSSNIHYETIIGSHAYGVADTSVQDKIPDYDIYGFVIPPKDMIFKNLTGWIPGFGPEPEGFNQFQRHDIQDNRQRWDIQIFNIVKFFNLCYENVPNTLDSLFTPENCVLHCTHIGRMVRDNRRLFLSKLCWKSFRGYAHSQLKKIKTKQPTGKRAVIVEKFGYDVKFAYHIIRLFDEVEQIMTDGDIDLQRSKEVMKSIRRGEWSLEQLQNWVIAKDSVLEVLYSKCTLPIRPPYEPIRQLLLNCLEEHYGSLKEIVAEVNWAEQSLRSIDNILSDIRKFL